MGVRCVMPRAERVEVVTASGAWQRSACIRTSLRGRAGEDPKRYVLRVHWQGGGTADLEIPTASGRS